MASKLDQILPMIMDADDSGLTLAAIRARTNGKTGARDKGREAALREKLAALVSSGAIWGPLRHRAAHYYFARGRGPSIETASAVVARLALQAGVKLLSRPILEKKVTGMNRRFFPDALKHAVASQTIMELGCGQSRYYLHRDVAAERFGFEQTTSTTPIAPPEPIKAAVPQIALEDLLPVYRRLKAEQGGFSAVKIFDLQTALNWPRDVLHRLLVQEAKSGRITIHPTTSVELPADVIDAGIRLPGFPEPFVTVVVKNEP
jgi:hypothetical protein